MRISADAGSIENVMGTSTATAIVAVNPGSEPITVPAITPPKARRKFSGLIAANRFSTAAISSPFHQVEK
jgi:hypothetical protein